MYTKNSYFKILVLLVMVITTMTPLWGEYDADGVDLLDRNPYGYCPFAVASGDFVYSANGTVMEVLDIHSLLPVGEVILESIVSSLAVSGNYVYIANWSDGFKVIDISNPTNPTLVAEIDFEGQCWDISVNGNYAYVGNNTEGLQIVDISNPLLPSLASTFLPVEVPAFEYTQVIDTIAYAATQQGLYILDVSDPTAPVQLGYSPSENGAWSVTVVDTIAFLPKNADGIRLVNVADPTNPIELGYFPTPGAAFWVEVVDTIAYVAERFSGIQILDISDLTAPDSIGMVEMDYADAVNIQGDSLYIASSSWGVKMFDISDPLSPVLLNENPGGGYAVDVYASETNTYIALRGLGVGIFSYNEASEPEMIGLIEMDNPNRVNGSGDYLYVIEDPNIHIIDVSDPVNPQILSTWYEGAALTSCAIGNLLYVGGHPDIQILDISDPSNPILLGELDGLPWVPFDIKVQGALAYVVNRGGGFWIIDVRDPTSPEVVSGLEIFDYAWRLDIAGQYVYIADRYSGQLRIIDVSNPSIPWETSGLNIGPSLRDVASSGRYAYCLDAWNGVRIIDCADPHNPGEVGYFNTGGYAQAIHAIDGQLYVADGGGGFYKLQTELKIAVFTVNSTGDGMDAIPGDGICDDGTGDCTLRAAINESNVTPGYNKIAFDIEGTGPHRIQPATAYPPIIDPVIIDATTEPDYSGSPLVEIDGTNVSTYEPAFQLLGGSTTIKGFVLNSFIDLGINNLEGGSNVIQGNYIGTDIPGTGARGNGMGGVGVSTSFNMIGGTEPGAGNLISGNGEMGIFIGGTEADMGQNNVIQGNFIGTDVTGTNAILNNVGVEIHTSNNLVGGANEGEGNLISGNRWGGVSIGHPDIPWAPSENRILGNRIGTDISGMIALPNGYGVTIHLSGSNRVGGSEPGAGNIISGNTYQGVQLAEAATSNFVQGNYIGTDATGTQPLGNGRYGVRISNGGSHNLVGGSADGEGNVISCNASGGVGIGYNGGADNNLIQGNIIGSDPSASLELGNGVSGVSIFVDATDNLVGGQNEGEGNLIVYNELAGVGINASASEVNNRVSRNSFYENGEVGIDLSLNNSYPYSDGFSENDPGDGDDGPNHMQNFPESLNMGVDDAGDLLIQYLVDSDAEHSEYPIAVEFFLSDEDGEGQMFLVDDEYTSENHELGLKTIVLGPVINYELEMGDYIVATATDANGNTSEFSEVAEIGNYVDVAAFEPLPEAFTLEQNYPNPFNPTTTIRYGLPEASDVSLVIYDLKGRVVQSYTAQSQPAGWVNYEWSGTNTRGELVSTGVYLCRMVAGHYSKTMKMVYLR